MIKCNNANIELSGTAPDLSTDYAYITSHLIKSLVDNTPLDVDDVINLMEKTFKIGVKSYFDWVGEDNED